MSSRNTQIEILKILDSCAEDYTFPVLDNGYVYLAESRLSVFRSPVNWAITIEVFGFSPRAGDPDLTVYTFSNALRNRRKLEDYVSEEAYENYLMNNRYNEFSSFWPISGEEWMDPDDSDLCLATGIYELRDQEYALPDQSEYEMVGVELEQSRPAVFEFCRYLAHHQRESVLATAEELAHHVPIDCKKRVQLSDWNHPDISSSELPSSKETFRELASLIESDNLDAYSSLEAPNTHWKNWPESGSL